MAAWNELLNELDALATDEAKTAWIRGRLQGALQAIALQRQNRNVLFYASAFLQKPQAPANLVQITAEDVNGLMSVIYGMDWARGLTLLLHTPGGVTNAAETLVAYLRSKFDYIEVVVPTFAMSAGTMIALATDRIVMGRQSQLGPIDPQLPIPMTGRVVSARAIVDQFDQAKGQIVQDVTTAHAWAPILQSLGPALLQEARYALQYGEDTVAGWLRDYMFKSRSDRDQKAAAVAAHFNDASIHKSHGRRIDRKEAVSQDLVVEELEANQAFQDEVLTAYHVSTLIFEKTPAAKLVTSHAGRTWVKNWGGSAKPPTKSPLPNQSLEPLPAGPPD